MFDSTDIQNMKSRLIQRYEASLDHYFDTSNRMEFSKDDTNFDSSEDQSRHLEKDEWRASFGLEKAKDYLVERITYFSSNENATGGFVPILIPDELKVVCDNLEEFISTYSQCEYRGYDSCDKWFTHWDIGHQGFSGSCIGWALAGLIDFKVNRDAYQKAHKLPLICARSGRKIDGKMSLEKFEIEAKYQSSPRFYWMIAKASERVDESIFEEKVGTDLFSGLKRIVKDKIYVSEHELPFLSSSPFFDVRGERFSELPMDPKALNSLHSIFKFKWVHENNVENLIPFLKVWTSIVGPFIVMFKADSGFVTLEHDPNESPFLEKRGVNKSFYHAVLGVGVIKHEGREFIKCKNSYGPNWGDKGFFYVSCQYLNKSNSTMYSLNII